ncbi:hypothetical protein D3C76_1705550 [compost metagenome]
MALAAGNHGADDRQNADHRQRRQDRLNAFDGFGKGVMDDQTQTNRDHHDLQNAQQHPHDVDADLGIDVQAGQQRRREDAHQRGDCRNGH